MKIILVGGMIAVGKTSIVEHLIKYQKNYERPQAYTTRSFRAGENEGQFKHISNKEMLKLKSEGKLLSYDEVYGEKYALALGAIEDINKQGNIAIKEYYMGDHLYIKNQYPEACSVIITPSSRNAYDHHINNYLPNKKQCRQDQETEFQVHQSIIDIGKPDIIIRNDFSKTIEQLSISLIMKYQKHLKEHFNN